MNLFSAMLAFMTCTLAGFMSAYRLNARVRALEILIADMKRLFSRMEYTHAPLTRIIAVYKDSGLSSLWSCMCCELEKGCTVFDAWRNAYAKTITQNTTVNALRKDEISALDELFSEMGASDMESQRRNFALFFDRIDAIYTASERERAARARLFQGMGTLSGVAIAILLL